MNQTKKARSSIGKCIDFYTNPFIFCIEPMTTHGDQSGVLLSIYDSSFPWVISAYTCIFRIAI